ncbi:MAG: hypothetical protein AB7N76_04730 [Planctomycetota bacterium]
MRPAPLTSLAPLLGAALLLAPAWAQDGPSAGPAEGDLEQRLTRFDEALSRLRAEARALRQELLRARSLERELRAELQAAYLQAAGRPMSPEELERALAELRAGLRAAARRTAQEAARRAGAPAPSPSPAPPTPTPASAPAATPSPRTSPQAASPAPSLPPIKPGPAGPGGVRAGQVYVFQIETRVGTSTTRSEIRYRVLEVRERLVRYQLVSVINGRELAQGPEWWRPQAAPAQGQATKPVDLELAGRSWRCQVLESETKEAVSRAWIPLVDGAPAWPIFVRSQTTSRRLGLETTTELVRID